MLGFPARVRFRVSSRLPRRGSAVRRARRSGFRRDGRAGGTGRCAGRRGSRLVHVSPQRGTRLPTLLACGKEARAVCGVRTPVCRLRRHLLFKTSGSLPTSAHVSCGRRCHVPPETGSSGQPRAGPAHTPRPRPQDGALRRAPHRVGHTGHPGRAVFGRLFPTRYRFASFEFQPHVVRFRADLVPAVSCPGVSSERGVALRQVRPSDVLATRGLPDGPCGFPVRRLPLLPPHLPALINQFFKIRVSSSFGSCMP